MFSVGRGTLPWLFQSLFTLLCIGAVGDFPPAVAQSPVQSTYQTNAVLEPLYQEGYKLLGQGRYANAEMTFQRGLTQARALHNDKYTALFLNGLGQVAYALDQFHKALDDFQEALAIRRKIGIPQEIAQSLSNVGAIQSSLSQNDKAVESYLEAIEIFEQNKNMRYLAACLTNLGSAYNSLGQYDQAQDALRRALKINEQIEKQLAQMGSPAEKIENRRDIAYRCNILGNLYYSLGQYDPALDYYQKAFTIFEKIGTPHEIATSLNNLGIVSYSLGQYDRALEYYQKAFNKSEKDGTPHEIAQSLNDLGAFYDDLGQNEQALETLQKAFTIFEKIGTPQEIAYCLNNLGRVYADRGQYDRALEYYQRALLIKEKSGNQQDIAQSLNNISTAYTHLGQYTQALGYLQQALKIKENIPNQSDIALSLHNLGNVYNYLGQYDKALDAHLRALEIFKKTGNQQDIAQSFNNLGKVAAANNQPRQAADYFTCALGIEHTLLRRVFAFTTESQMRDFLSRLPNSLDNLLALTIQPPAPTPQQRTQALLWTLRRKGSILNALLTFQQTRRMIHDDHHLRDLYNLLLVQRAQANRLNPTSNQRQQAEQTENKLKLAFAKRYPTPPDTLDLVQLQQHLPAHSALIEFIRITPANVKTPDRLLPARYLAFVLKSKDAAPDLIDLGDAADLDAAVTSTRQSMLDFIALYNQTKRHPPLQQQQQNEQAFKQAAADLYLKVFAPLQPALTGVTMLLIAPDGTLNRFPFEALPDANGQYLVRSYRISYLTSGRDLLRPPAISSNRSLAFIAPDFDLPVAEHFQRSKALRSGASIAPNQMGRAGVMPILLSGAGTDSAHAFDPLLGMEGHIHAIKEQLGIQPLIGAAALEERFLSVSSPRVLHVLTHGFYVPEPAIVAKAETGSNPGAANPVNQRLSVLSDPMLRSGIALAGANRWQEAQKLKIELGDGWVTAAKMAEMDLRGTQLVTLAACETGLGDVHNGEGVYGIRRALVLAGARSLLTSLWEVPPQETAALTERFYANLQNGMGRGEALREAQLSLLGREATSHPLYWAGFVLIGETGPLHLSNDK